MDNSGGEEEEEDCASGSEAQSSSDKEEEEGQSGGEGREVDPLPSDSGAPQQALRCAGPFCLVPALPWASHLPASACC